MPLVGYITHSRLTHMHGDATSVQLHHSRASSFPGLRRRQPFNPAGNESQIGKTLGGPVVGLRSTPLLIFSHASTSRHSTQRGNLKQERTHPSAGKVFVVALLLSLLSIFLERRREAAANFSRADLLFLALFLLSLVSENSARFH